MITSNVQQDLRVLIVAMHASTQFGGEAILPLHWFKGLREENVEVWLLVHERTRSELKETLGDDYYRVQFIKDRLIHKVLWKIGKHLPARIHTFSTGQLLNLATQFEQRRMVKKIISKNDINILHEPIPVSPKLPSMMYGFSIPVIIGPLNGGMTYPEGFRGREPFWEKWFTIVARKFSLLANTLIPGKLQASAILVANTRTKQALPCQFHENIITFVENGVDLKLWASHDNKGTSSPVTRFVYLGRLINLKCVDLLVKAFSQAINNGMNAELWIIGDGPLRGEIEHQIIRCNLEQRVTLHGWVSQEKCPALLKQCDALVLPSILECGGAVVLEAMALALPVIAANWGGPADYLNDECGILIPPSSETQFTSDLATALYKLNSSPEMRIEMGLAGRARVEKEFSWNKKIQNILSVYVDNSKR